MRITPCRCGRLAACVIAAIALTVTAGCSSRRHGEPFTPIVYSPIGEPLASERSTRQQCREAVAGWFARVDANHDGSIDRTELMDDAARLFDAMDIDKDGTV